LHAGGTCGFLLWTFASQSDPATPLTIISNNESCRIFRSKAHFLGTVVVISNVPDRKMSSAEACSLSQAMCGSGLRLHLQVLHIVVLNSGGPCHIDWEASEDWLLAASVVFLKAPFCGAEVGVDMACSCSGWALAAACEHACFVEASDLPHKPTTPKLASKEVLWVSALPKDQEMN